MWVGTLRVLRHYRPRPAPCLALVARVAIPVLPAVPAAAISAQSGADVAGAYRRAHEAENVLLANLWYAIDLYAALLTTPVDGGVS